jgi:hypothetical protein
MSARQSSPNKTSGTRNKASNPLQPAAHSRLTEASRFLTTAALAQMFSLPASTLRYWRRIGLGPRSTKFGRSIRYDLRDVEEYVEECRTAAGWARARTGDRHA